MRLTKAFGFAVVAAMAAIAFVGTSSASAAGEVVLCKSLVEPCPAGEQWPSGTTLQALATDPELLGTVNIKCEDSLVEGTTNTQSGNPLNATISVLSFGKLPTPTLGQGCTMCDEVHVIVPIAARLEMTADGKYWFLGQGLALALDCTFLNVDCGYEGHVKAQITHTGSHPKHSGTTLPVINILQEVDIHKSNFGCGSSAEWHAKYVLTLAKFNGEAGLVWPSLNSEEVTDHEVVLCKELQTPHALCADDDVLPAGTKLLALAANTEFKAGSLKAVKCEDSLIEAETTSAMGSVLGFEITSIEFGTLPTPELGKGCTSCTSGVHPPPLIVGSIEAGAGDDYVFNSSEAFEVLGCFGLGITCVYGSDSLVSLVDPDSGEHAKAPNKKGYAQILVTGTLSFIKGSNFCPETGLWTANYVVYAVESEGKATDGWLALYAALGP